VSYTISQNIRKSIQQATDSVFAGTIQGKNTEAGKDFLARMMTNKLTTDESALAGNAPKGTMQSDSSLNLPTYQQNNQKTDFTKYNNSVVNHFNGKRSKPEPRPHHQQHDQ